MDSLSHQLQPCPWFSTLGRAEYRPKWAVREQQGAILSHTSPTYHFFAGIKQGILGTLAHDILRRPQNHTQHQWRQADQSCHRLHGFAKEIRRKEAQTRHPQHERCNGGRNAPTKLLKDGAPKEHHDECHGARGTGKVPHKGRVRVGVGKCLLELGFPAHFDNVNAHSVGTVGGRTSVR